MSTTHQTLAKSNYHHGDLREALIAAATDLVGQMGPESFSMVDACKLAGVSKSAPYRHFENKRALLKAVCEAGFGRMLERLEAARSGSEPGSNNRIADIGLAYIHFATEEPAVFKLMFGNSLPFDDEEHGERGHETFELLMGEIITRTGLHDFADLMRVARPLWTLVHGASMLTIDHSYNKIDPDGDNESMVRESTALILAPYPELQEQSR